ncbi:hypothetical protein HMPREF1249_0045 [Jonquetella sp. BV3C21]|nr:hypothetical protein HMPREF1249_0045 [Jonquetella sp. BV3C21]
MEGPGRRGAKWQSFMLTVEFRRLENCLRLSRLLPFVG